MACPDRRFPVPGRALGQRADGVRCALLGSSVSMETSEIFRVTINSLITVFDCHLSLIKDKNLHIQGDGRSNYSQKQQVLLSCCRNSALNCDADALVLEKIWFLICCEELQSDKLFYLI